MTEEGRQAMPAWWPDDGDIDPDRLGPFLAEEYRRVCQGIAAQLIRGEITIQEFQRARVELFELFQKL